MKRLPKAQSRLCPDSQISSAIIPAQSPAAHNQPHETGAWVVAHALGLETDIPLGGFHNENIPWHSCITNEKGLCITNTPISVVPPKRTEAQSAIKLTKEL